MDTYANSTTQPQQQQTASLNSMELALKLTAANGKEVYDSIMNFSRSCCDNNINDYCRYRLHKLNSHCFIFGADPAYDWLPTMSAQYAVWKCPCGLKMKTAKSFLQHVRTAHLKHMSDPKGIGEFLLTPHGQANGSAVELIKAQKNQQTIRRLWILKHGFSKTMAKSFSSTFPEERIRLFQKPPRDNQRMELTAFVYKRRKTFLLNRLEDNSKILEAFAQADADGTVRMVGVGQVLTASVFGYDVASVNFDFDVNRIAKHGFGLVSVLSLCRAMWLASNEIRMLLLLAIASYICTNSETRTAFMKASKILLDSLDGRPQGQSLDRTWLTAIVTILAIALFKSVPPKGLLNDFSKAAQSAGNLSLGAVRTADGVTKLLDFIAGQGAETLFGVSLHDDALRILQQELEITARRIDLLIERETTESKNEDYCLEVKDCYLEFSKFQSRFTGKFASPTFSTQLTSLSLKIGKLNDRCQRSGVLSGGGRVEPVVICFNGASGIGKSHIIMAFCAKIVHRLRPDLQDKWLSDIYVRSASTEFWSNYREQSVVLYDDFGQMVDSATSPNAEFIEMIRCQNVTDYPLNMANLEDKANTYFRSKLICLTTNTARPVARSLTHNEALVRRLEFNFRVVPKPHMIAGGKCQIVDTPHPDNYNYYLSMAGGQESPTPMQAKDVLQLICTQLEEKKRRFEEMKTGLGGLNDQMNFDDLPNRTPIFQRPEDHLIETELLAVDEIDLNGTLEPIPVDPVDLDNFVNDIGAAYGQSHWWERSKLYARQIAARVISNLTPPTISEHTLFYRVNRDTPYVIVKDSIENYPTLKSRSVYWEGVLASGQPTYDRGFMVTQRGYDQLIDDNTYESEKLKNNYYGHGLFVKTPCTAALDWISWLARLAFIANLLYTIVSMLPWFSKEKTPSVYSSDHQGLKHGERKEHKHICAACGNIFTHSHVIDHKDNRTLLCSICNKLNPSIEAKRTPEEDEPIRIDESYDEHTPKTAKRYEVYSTDTTKTKPRCEVYTNDTYKPRTAIVESYIDIEKYFKKLCTYLNGEGEAPENLSYFQLSPEDKLFVDKTLTTAHKERTTKHIDALKRLYGKFREFLHNIQYDALEIHDASKYTLFEMIGYSLKWHDPNGEILERLQKLVGTVLDADKIWKSSLTHHYANNSHHPKKDLNDTERYMTSADLEEAILDMCASKWERNGFPELNTLTWEWVEETVWGDDGKWLTPYSADQQTYLRMVFDKTGQYVTDHNARLLTLSIRKNAYSVFIGDDQETWTKLQNIFVVTGRVAVINRHAIATLKSCKYLRLVNCSGKTYTFETKSLEVKCFETSRTDDFGLVSFPPQMPDHVSFVNHIISKTQLSRFTSTNATLCVPTTIDGKSTKVEMNSFVVTAKVGTRRTYVTQNVEGPREWETAMVYEYRAETQAGDCGSPLVAVNNSIPNKVLGFHTWGMISGTGGAMIVTKEEMELMLTHFSRYAQAALPIQSEKHDGSLNDTMYMTTGETTMAPMASKTKLRRTSLDYRPSRMAPAILRKIGDKDPLRVGVRKYDINLPHIDEDLVAEAVADYKSVINSGHNIEHYRSKSRLTINEAIQGVPELTFMDSINRTTSPGYPYVLTKRAKRGKQDLIDDDFNVAPNLREDIENRIKTNSEGQRVPTLWMDNLKDEKRPIDKVKLGKTRIFCGGPVDYTVAFRMFFLAFCAYACVNRIGNEMAVGINPYDEWQHLALHLTKKGTKVVAGDFSKFDSTLHAQILNGVLDIVNDWAGDGNDLTRQMLWREIVNSNHITGTQTYAIDHGNPSGNPMTAIVNSMYNSIASRIVWKMVTGLPISQFKKEVSMISYGDDNVYNISDRVIDIFNQGTITEGFAKIGMVYTREDKTQNVEELHRNLTQIDFLKRAFRYEDKINKWVAPLSLDSILEIPLWIKTDVDIEEQVIENVETALSELSLHGEEIYAYWNKTIEENCRRNLDNQPTFLPWSVQFEQIVGTKPGMGQGEITVIDLQQNPNRGIPLGMVEEDVDLPIGQCVPPKNKAIDPVSGRDGMMQPPEDSTTCIANTIETSTMNLSSTPTVSNVGADHMLNEGGLTQETQQIMQVRTDQPVQEEIAIASVPYLKPYKDQDYDIKKVLERFVEIASGSWKDTDAVGAQVELNSDIVGIRPQNLLYQHTNFGDKLKRFAYVKYGAKVRVQINTTRFQTGKLLCYCYPLTEVETDASSNPDVANGIENLYNNSNVRHVEIDAGTSEEVEIEMPFYSNSEIGRNVNNARDFPKWFFGIQVLNPLQGTSTGEVVDITVFAAALDPEFTMPSGQSNSQTEGEKKTTKGLISSTLDTVSNVAGSLTAIPLLADIAGPVSWAAGAAAGIASFFGFSKPTNEGVTSSYCAIPAKGFTHTDGLDNSTKMALSNSNAIEQESEYDEMAITHLTKRPGMIDQFPWSFDNAVGTKLFEQDVNPGGAKDFSVPNGDTISVLTPLAYVARLFQLWRGSITYRFSFAKNAFYSGKLVVEFHPDTDSSNYTEDVYRRVVTIKDSSDFSVTIPYCSYKPWMRNTEKLGRISVSVQNRLQATDTVAPTIWCNVWKCSNAIDFAIPTTNLPELAEYVQYQALAYGQSNYQSPSNAGEITDDPLFMSNDYTDFKNTIGEVVSNLRALTRRLTRYGLTTDGTNSWSSAMVAFPPTYQVEGPSNPQSHPLEYIGGPFLFERGSLRIKCAGTGIPIVQQVPADVGLGLFTNQTGKIQALEHGIFSDANNIIEIELPFYNDRARRFCRRQDVNLFEVAYSINWVDADGNLVAKPHAVWLGAGDDFTYSFFRRLPFIVKRASSPPKVTF